MKKTKKTSQAKAAEESKYVQIVKITAKGKRTLYIPRASYEAQQRRIHHKFLGRITSGSKLQGIHPDAVLFGPAHRDINPKAPASWTPENNREYIKKWTK